MSRTKLKEPTAAAALFDTHAGHHSSSRTSNTYSNAGRETTTYVPDARMQAFRLPSRMGNQLHYPDGTVEETNHARHNPNT